MKKTAVNLAGVFILGIEVGALLALIFDRSNQRRETERSSSDSLRA